MRYDPDGTLDRTFGGDGKVTTDFGGEFDIAFGMALQPDGKIVAVGATGDVPEFLFSLAVARYHPDGSLDRSFGGDGMVTTVFPGRDDSSAEGVAIQRDGRIVAAGGAAFAWPADVPPAETGSDFGLARYRTDGSLDPSFGTGGRVVTNFFSTPADRNGFDNAFAVALQPDGRIVAAGEATTPGGASRDIALVRYHG